MAVPKRKVSKARQRKRATHKGARMPNVPDLQKDRPKSSRSKRFFCVNCDQPKPPHAVCPNCGHYRGNAVLEVER